MRSVALVILLVFISWTHANEQVGNGIDTLVDNLFDRIFEVSLRKQVDVDDTVLRKEGHVGGLRQAAPLLPSFSLPLPRYPTLGVSTWLWASNWRQCHWHRASAHLHLQAQAHLGEGETSGIGSSSRQMSSLLPPQEMIREGKFAWDKMGVNIQYLKIEGPAQARGGKSPLLFLPGFGVASFQFTQNLQKAARHRDAYAMDWLGQGRSWPSETDLEGLQFSADMWVEQAHAFINEVIKGPVHVAGNSLGGFIAAQLAAKYPEDVRGVTLLNATPFWAFRNATNSLSPLNSLWDGRLPAPEPYKSLATSAFDSLRDATNVKRILDLVYADSSVVSPSLVKNITDAAAHPVGPDAFASIAFSPKANLPFADALQSSARNGVKFLMLYGRDDPWVVPLWGQRAYLNLRLAAALSSKSVGDVVRYLEITPAGHCPHDEAPETVGQVLEKWLQSVESVESLKSIESIASIGGVDEAKQNEAATAPHFRYPSEVQEEGGRMMSVEDVGGQQARNVGEWLGTFLMRARISKLPETSY